MSGRPRLLLALLTVLALGLLLLLVFGATDRSSLLGLGRFALWTEIALVNSASFAIVAAVSLAILFACVYVIARDAWWPPPPAVDAPGEASSARHQAAFWLTMLFAGVFLAKLQLIQDNPVTSPFWDQWDAEAAVLFVPFNNHTLEWRTMFDLHNEHRIFFSRLLALGLFAANGQWDPRLEQVANALMHALTVTMLSAVLWMASRRRHLTLFVLVGATIGALPFGWENTLIGFQSAFYFLLLFSVPALWLTITSHPCTLPWWLGWLCATCGLFTAAGGALTPVAIGGVAALKLAVDRRWREAMVNGGAAILVVGLGFAMASPPLAHHAALKAHSAAEFGLALARGLAWPWIDRPLFAVVAWLPLAALLVESVFRPAGTALERLALGLGLWVVLNAAALAYGRGAGAALPATRYLDFLSLGFAANVAALIELFERAQSKPLARQLALAALVGWTLVAVVGIDRLVVRATTDLAVWRQYFAAQATSVRRFVMTDDAATLLSHPPLVEVPYPDPNRLVMLLQDPYIRRVLPAAVRSPLRVEPRISTNDAFVMDGPFIDSLPRDPLQRSWLSLSGAGRRAKGRFVSQPLECELNRRLKITVSGYLGWVDQYLALRDLASGREVPVRPGRPPREAWVDVVLPCPQGPFEIVAIDDTDGSWFGFREPVEIGWASAGAESLIRNSRLPFVVMLTVSVLALAYRWPRSPT